MIDKTIVYDRPQQQSIDQMKDIANGNIDFLVKIVKGHWNMAMLPYNGKNYIVRKSPPLPLIMIRDGRWDIFCRWLNMIEKMRPHDTIEYLYENDSLILYSNFEVEVVK